MKSVLGLLLPVSLVSAILAFRAPRLVESLYAQQLYPLVARGIAFVNRAPFSIAEPLTVAALVTVSWLSWRAWRDEAGAVRRLASWLVPVLGVGLSSFLLSWGLNYARPPLRQRMALETGAIEAEAVLDAGIRTARLAGTLFRELGEGTGPTALPMGFGELNEALDRAYSGLELPGDPIDFTPTPAKGLWSSTLFSYLGVSGIYVPFTGEPSVNVLQPDVVLPVVVAHEKAHQRGITDEGEANFAAFLACARPENPVYVRYAAYLFATRYLLGEASRYAPREAVDDAWALLGDGPLQDVRAIEEFWRRYQGAASRVASRVNDGYLRTLQVPQGVQSYGTVVALLMALDRRGALLPG